MIGCWCPVPGPQWDCVCYITTSSELLDQTTWRTENHSTSRTLWSSTTSSRPVSASGSGWELPASGWLGDTTGCVNQWTTQVKLIFWYYKAVAFKADKYVYFTVSCLDSYDAMYALDMTWWYFFSKFIDYFDSLFFLLRKKFTHLSTLHVIHHGIMPLTAWSGVK